MTCIAVLSPLAAAAQVMGGSDDAILDMANAARRGDGVRLTALLPQAQGHVLEPWAAYWELKPRLEAATYAEVDAFLQRYAGTYQEDRLRNDWLLVLGKRGDFQGFARYYPAFRMRDDRDVACYSVHANALQGNPQADDVLMLRENWYALRDASDACELAARSLLASRRIGAADVWRKARLAAEGNRMGAARGAVGVMDAAAAMQVPGAFSGPAVFLASADAGTPTGRELAVLALTRLAASNPASAAQAMQAGWAGRLEREQRNWVWGEIGKQATLNLDTSAMNYFSQVSSLKDLDDMKLAWMARSALRMGYWPQVRQAIDAMSTGAQRDPAWVYWKARALQGGLHLGHARDREAAQLYRSIAGNAGFYEQLATEALGERIGLPRTPSPLTQEERAHARANAGLQRALYAMNLGLRSEATREWNYTTNLHQQGGMNDRDLLAAADLACSQQWWDRCINTSERTKGVIDMQQRFPMPYRNAIVSHSQATGVDPAFVYGLIRQESRFVTHARSGVGATGLMQVMPATASHTARKLGIPYAGGLSDMDTNLRIGTGYLKLLLDDFQNSLPLATAAYNAGPGRPRNWRNGPVQEGAAWAESIPFAETRDYVKKVAANTVNYALLLGNGQQQSLRQRLGQVGPLAPGFGDASDDSPRSGAVRVLPADDAVRTSPFGAGDAS